MAAWYFYLKEDLTQGPVPASEILEKLHQGDLTVLDPVCREGESEWKPISEQEDLREALSSKPSEASVSSDLWVALVPKPLHRGKGYLQIGPMTTDQVRRQLDQGKLRYSDHLWRQGLSEWRQISEIEEFSPLTQRPVEGGALNQELTLPPAPNWSSRELLESVLKASDLKPTSIRRSSKRQEPEVLPHEVDPGQELVSEFLESGKPPSRPKTKPRRAPDKGVNSKKTIKQKPKPSRAGHFVDRIRRHQIFIHPPLWLKVLPLMLLIGGFVAHLLWTSSPRWSVPEPWWPGAHLEGEEVIPSAPSAPTPSKQEAQASASRKKKAAAPQKKASPPPPAEERRRASYLRVRVEGAAAGRPVLHFRSDASSHFLIRILVQARAGHVEDRSHVWQWHRFTRPAGQEFRFSFSEHKLPRGKYKVRAQVNDQIVELDVVSGPNNQAHRQKLAQTFKKNKWVYQQEKRRLWRLSQQLVRAETRGVAPRGASWTQVRQLNSNNMGNYVFPDLWLRMKDLDEQFQSALRAPPTEREGLRAQVRQNLQAYHRELARFSPLGP